MDVDAIIVTYQSEATIAVAIRSARASGLTGRIMVVDNASRDDSALFAEHAGADEVLRNRANEGFAKAVNQALRRCGASRILLLNPDARIDRETLAALSTALDAEPRAALAAPLLVDHDGRADLGATRFSTLSNRVGMCLPLLGRLPWLRPDYPRAKHIARSGVVVPVDSIWGAVVLADGAFLRSIGGFDERFFLFSEDEDLCRQARVAGRLVLLVTGARATHAGGASSADVAIREALRLHAAGRLFEKWDGLDAAVRFSRLIAAAFCLREALFSALAPFSKSARTRAEEARRLGTLFAEMAARGSAR